MSKNKTKSFKYIGIGRIRDMDDVEIVVLILFAIVTIGNIFCIAYNIDNWSRFFTYASLALFIEIVAHSIWEIIKKTKQIDE